MKKYNIKYFFIVFILFIYSLFNIGGSSFVINKEIDIKNISISNGDKAVCYYEKDNKTYKYTTVEKALEVCKNDTSNNTIYVIPGTNPIITRDCEIASGDTLCLPYEGKTWKVDLNNVGSSNSSFNNYCNVNFADENETQYLKSNVTIEGTSETKSTTLTVNGTLLIGGILGVGTGSYQKPSGHTVNNYTQITMKNYASIVNKGTIECRGYIKPFDQNSINNCSFINESGSTTIMPFVLYDYRGGSYSAACDNEGVFPFNVFDMPNSHVNSTYKFGSILKVLIHAFANSKIYSPNPSVLLSNNSGLFKLSNGSISFRYKPSTFNKTTNDVKNNTLEAGLNKMIILINGTVTLDSMTISLAGNSVATKDYHIPFSYKFDIKIKNGSTLNISNKVKLLSGSYLTIEQGCTMNVDAPMVCYRLYNGHNKLADVYPNSLGPSNLINNGTVHINASFGGKIDTNVVSATITTSSNFKSEIKSREVLTGSNYGSDRVYFDITSYGYCSFYDINSNKPLDAQLLSTNSYSSNQSSSKFYWVGNYGNTTVAESHGPEQTVESCITENTLIMMTDGTYKKAIDIRSGDLAMSINHETGNIEPAPIVFNDHIDGEASSYNVISLEFSNNKKVEVVFEHGFFDLDTMQYEYITEDNYDKLIGHRFVTIDYIDGKAVKNSATLTSAYIEEKNIRICSPITYKNLNIITENMLSMPGGISGLFNIFEYDDNLAYDPIKKQNDINNYGLLDYSYFNNSIPYEVYEAFNGQYLQVAMAKGILTEEMLNKYIEHYLPIISEQTNNR